jgi:hypothetical protein
LGLPTTDRQMLFFLSRFIDIAVVTVVLSAFT